MKLDTKTLTLVFTSLASLAVNADVPVIARHNSLPSLGAVNNTVCDGTFKGLQPGESVYKNNPTLHQKFLGRGQDVVLGNDCKGYFFHIDESGALVRRSSQVNLDFIRKHRKASPALFLAKAKNALAQAYPTDNTPPPPPVTPVATPELAPTQWYQLKNFLPVQASPSQLTFTTINPPQKFWETTKTRCVTPSGMAFKLGEGIIPDTHSVYQVVLDKNAQCTAKNILTITPADPSTAQELVAHISQVAPPVGVYLNGKNPIIPDRPVKIEGVAGGGVKMWEDMTLALMLHMSLPRTACNTGADTDQDGLADAVEQQGVTAQDGQLYRTKVDNKDSDEDGLLDGEELELDTNTCRATLIANPLVADSDQDFVPDGDEVDEGTEPLNPDSDSDGLNDGGERLWGTEPFLKDTDGDGFEDFFEVQNQDYGFQPLVPEQMLSAPSFLHDIEVGRDAVKGGVCGDICDLNTVPELSGAIATSVIPLVGVVADVRDYFANAVKGDSVSMFFAAAGTIPFAGDAARATQMTVRHVTRHPEQMQDVFRMVANATYIPEQPRAIMFSSVLAAGDKATAFSLFSQHALQPATVARLSANGARLDHLAKVFDECGGKCIKRDVATAGANGWMGNYVDAEKFLRGATEKPTALPPPPRQKTDVRFYDAIVGDTAMEAKTGYVTNNKRVLRQIEKDCGMMGRPEIVKNGVQWHFFASAKSNSIGAAPEILKALKNCKNGAIPFFFHIP